ncbi:MAG TPA: hypothetical protein VI485_05805 [Vicinamibacterales bacterium]|nr:hypothetical protein [Vicinamibacterales bacterium]
MAVDPRERLLLLEPVFLPVIGIDLDRLLVQERLVQPVELLLNRGESALDLCHTRSRVVAELAPGEDDAVLHQSHVAR